MKVSDLNYAPPEKNSAGPKPGFGKRFARGFIRVCARNHVRPFVGVALIILLMLVIALGSILLFGNGGKVLYSAKTIDFGLENIGELATQAGYYTNVNTIRKPDRTIAGIPVPGTSSKAIMTYQGVIRAGLDFDEIKMTVDHTKKQVVLDMPAVRILSNEIDLDSCEVYDEQNSIFNKIDISNFNQSLSDMKSKVEEQAQSNHILEAARINAETLIRTMFKSAAGTEGYQLIFRWTEAGGESDASGQ